MSFLDVKQLLPNIRIRKHFPFRNILLSSSLMHLSWNVIFSGRCFLATGFNKSYASHEFIPAVKLYKSFSTSLPSNFNLGWFRVITYFSFPLPRGFSNCSRDSLKMYTSRSPLVRLNFPYFGLHISGSSHTLHLELKPVKRLHLFTKIQNKSSQWRLVWSGKGIIVKTGHVGVRSSPPTRALCLPYTDWGKVRLA